MWYMRRQIAQIFLSTPSARRATRSGWPAGYRLAISIHALREEGDEASKFAAQRTKLFLSTPSARRATNDHNARIKEEQFLSTPSARRATPRSIMRLQVRYNFYPRPPRGGRQNGKSSVSSISEFLSTPSARRATTKRFNINLTEKISIHALREEGDSVPTAVVTARRNFYPRPPRGGRLPCHRWRFRGSPISIHALREEGDRRRCRETTDQGYFYPRPPRGGRHNSPTARERPYQFLSTPSARRATATFCGKPVESVISIHALREEGDAASAAPFGGLMISIHALREEGDTMSFAPLAWQSYFYPRPPRGGRRGWS